jgi:GntR family transcriptional regulator
MDILISNSTGQPIYEQIYSQIRTMILNSTLKEGDSLPSMRLLAKELRISVITTKRAYEELERDGFIETVTGKGSFVGKNNLEFMKEEHLKSMEHNLVKAIQDSKLANLSLVELKELLDLLYLEQNE